MAMRPRELDDFKGVCHFVTSRQNFTLKDYFSRQNLSIIRWGNGYTTTLPLELSHKGILQRTLLDWNWIN